MNQSVQHRAEQEPSYVALWEYQIHLEKSSAYVDMWRNKIIPKLTEIGIKQMKVLTAENKGTFHLNIFIPLPNSALAKRVIDVADNVAGVDTSLQIWDPELREAVINKTFFMMLDRPDLSISEASEDESSHSFLTGKNPSLINNKQFDDWLENHLHMHQAKAQSAENTK